VVPPKEALARLNVDNGDELYLTPAPDLYRITPQPEGLADQLEQARAIMKRRRAVLRELAK